MRRFLKAIIVRVEDGLPDPVADARRRRAIWGFFNIASEVGEGETLVLDKRILLALRAIPPTQPTPSDPRGSRRRCGMSTALGGVTVLTLVTIVATLALLLHGKRRRAAIFASIVAAALISDTFLKDIYNRPRPELVPHGSYVYSSSFPSGHSTLAAVTYLTLATMISSLEPKPGTKALVYAVAGLVTVSVGFSRVYLGVHWPSDVLAGWSLGAAWALIGWISLRLLQDRDSGRGLQPIFQTRPCVRRQRRLEPQRLAGDRVCKSQHRRMQGLALQARRRDRVAHRLDRLAGAIDRITQAGRALGRQVDADLMGAAGLERAGYSGGDRLLGRAESAVGGIVGYGLASARLQHRHLLAVSGRERPMRVVIVSLAGSRRPGSRAT